jgi:hypothetical protein
MPIGKVSQMVRGNKKAGAFGLGSDCALFATPPSQPDYSSHGARGCQPSPEHSGAKKRSRHGVAAAGRRLQWSCPAVLSQPPSGAALIRLFVSNSLTVSARPSPRSPLLPSCFFLLSLLLLPRSPLLPTCFFLLPLPLRALGGEFPFFLLPFSLRRYDLP